MSGPPAATAAVRVAVRRSLRDLDAAVRVAAAGSGGADSLALAAALAFERPRSYAFVVDHGLQPGSDEVAARAAEQCRGLGLVAEVLTRTTRPAVGGAPRPGGPEAIARELRYRLLEMSAQRCGAAVVLLGHT